VQKLYLILIASVFILSIVFAILIWKQTIKFEKKALEAKRAREKFLNQLKLEREKEEEERRKAEELRLREQKEQEITEDKQEQDIEENTL
jgi:flagellar biosynthesis/type III secretory pathway M-ring protein FliF/YscJ